MSPVPVSARDYDTREPVESPWVNERWDCKVSLLVPPGTYDFEFVHPDGTIGTDRVTVTDFVAEAVPVPFRDGQEILIREGTRDPQVIAENPYKTLDVRDRVVLDIGAHIGTFSRDAVSRGAREVVAVEPGPDNIVLLRRNVDGLPVRVVHAAAVGDASQTECTLYVDAREMKRNALHSLHRTRGDRVPVRASCVSFLRLIAEVRPDVIKVDVEGSEYTYPWSRLPDFVKEIACEFEDETDEILRVWRDLGFEIVKPPTKGWATVVVARR